MEKICQKKRIRNQFHTLKKTANIFKKLLGKEIHFERSSNTLKKSNFIFLFEPSVPSVEIIRKNKRPGTSYQSIHRLPNLFLKTCVCVSGSKKCSFLRKKNAYVLNEGSLGRSSQVQFICWVQRIIFKTPQIRYYLSKVMGFF